LHVDDTLADDRRKVLAQTASKQVGSSSSSTGDEPRRLATLPEVVNAAAWTATVTKSTRAPKGGVSDDDRLVFVERPGNLRPGIAAAEWRTRDRRAAGHHDDGASWVERELDHVAIEIEVDRDANSRTKSGPAGH
jgi:hypothetical protein